jgi:hypothetical protein
MRYGILKSNYNTGLDSELACVFSTPLSLVSNQPAYISDTMSLRRKAHSQNVQRWELQANIVPTNDSVNYLVHSVMNGHTNVIYIRMPQVFRPDSNKTRKGLIFTMSNSVSAGTDTFNITEDTIQPLAVGEFISFVGHSKVYLVIDSGIGNAGVKISPSLRQGVSAGTQIIYGDKVTLSARYDIDVALGMTYSDGILINPGSVKFVEAL